MKPNRSADLLSAVRKWRSDVGSVVPPPPIPHPGFREDVACLAAMAATDLVEPIERELLAAVTEVAYPALAAHRLVSCQPWADGIPLLAGRPEEVFDLPPPQPTLIPLGDGYLADAVAEGLVTTLSRLVTTVATAWDNFVTSEIERGAGVRRRVETAWGGAAVGRLLWLKEEVEEVGGLPVTWIMAGNRLLTSLRDDAWYTPAATDTEYLSGVAHVGRWRQADVYCNNLLSDETLAVVGYRGNLPHEAALVAAVSRLVVPDPVWGQTQLSGVGDCVSGWPGSEETIGRLRLE